MPLLQKYINELIHSAEIPAHSIDKEGKLLAVSYGWLTLLGYTKDQVIGRKSTEFLTEESKKLAAKVLPEYYETGKCHDIPYTFVDSDGRGVSVLLSADSVWRDGEFLRSIAVLRPTDPQAVRARADKITAWKLGQQTDVQVLLENLEVLELNCEVTLRCKNEAWFTYVVSAASYFQGVDAIRLKLEGSQREVLINLGLGQRQTP